ncbi:hypothetical protein Scep_019490 [Stephania cephalantha]|uniref:Uncharacterized protein n=1 Tax=Stephania cephalantha TaxID=152367 RepID=A0AAP0NPV8_9MAGN
MGIQQDLKADDLRQMFMAMTEEVRVIIVKLADRLHNMRTLSHMPQHKLVLFPFIIHFDVVKVILMYNLYSLFLHKQSSIASETLQVFAPLAKLLGIYQIKVYPASCFPSSCLYVLLFNSGG